MKLSTITKGALILAAAMYGACLPLDAAVFDRTCPPTFDSPKDAAPVAGVGNPPLGETSIAISFLCLLLGWLALFGGLGAIGWLANPFAIIAVVKIAYGKVVTARWCAVLSFVFAATSLYATNVFYLVGDEGGVCRTSAISPLIGYWLWLGSTVMLLIGTVLTRNTSTKLT